MMDWVPGNLLYGSQTCDKQSATLSFAHHTCICVVVTVETAKRRVVVAHGMAVVLTKQCRIILNQQKRPILLQIPC